ncbi:hypothetical protein FA13DRAFT_242577 [Coprinellus micaceus]|uniref:Uncharacterized protein n=1 Tax=Coprinellus micaceus TaxID=71717 RepID=A0A4Y7SFP3_COPMI|nr:hypothetical protein FA13DRAFT_242577 [Coprinellus micaceus]
MVDFRLCSIRRAVGLNLRPQRQFRIRAQVLFNSGRRRTRSTLGSQSLFGEARARTYDNRRFPDPQGSYPLTPIPTFPSFPSGAHLIPHAYLVRSLNGNNTECLGGSTLICDEGKERPIARAWACCGVSLTPQSVIHESMEGLYRLCASAVRRTSTPTRLSTL